MSLTPLPVGFWRANTTALVLMAIAFACLGIVFLAIGFAFLPELWAFAVFGFLGAAVSYSFAFVWARVSLGAWRTRTWHLYVNRIAVTWMLWAATLSSVFVTIVSFADNRVVSAVIAIGVAIATFVGAVLSTRWLLAWPRVLKASEVPAGYVVLPASVQVMGGGPRSLGMASIAYVDPSGATRHVRDIPTGDGKVSAACVLVDPARPESPIRYFDSFDPRA